MNKETFLTLVMNDYLIKSKSDFKAFLKDVDVLNLSKEKREEINKELFVISNKYCIEYFDYIIELVKHNSDALLTFVQKEIILYFDKEEGQSEVLIGLKDKTLNESIQTLTKIAFDEMEIFDLELADEDIKNIFYGILVDYGIKIGLYKKNDGKIVLS